MGASGPAKPAWRVPRMGRCLGMVPLAGRNTPCRRSENTIGCSIACRPCQPQSTQRRKVACFLNGWPLGFGARSAATSESNHTLFLEEAAGAQSQVPKLLTRHGNLSIETTGRRPAQGKCRGAPRVGEAAQQCSSLGAGSLCLGNVLAVSGSYFWVPVTQGYRPEASRLTPPDTLKWGSHCASGRLWRGRSGAQPP